MSYGNGYDRKIATAFEKFSRMADLGVAKPGTNYRFVFESGY
jgi:hypothetical protein